MNRFWLYFALAAAMIAYGQWSEAGEVPLKDHPVYDREGAFRIKTVEGDSFVCLLTAEGNGFTEVIDPRVQVAMTCAEIGVEGLAWRYCIGGYELLSCAPPATDVAPREKPDIIMELSR